MANKMLIDAMHPEETRVVVLRGSRIEEFDFESASKRQLRGNIYLAKVIRVEPSLQAAFVDYGGNRHGFLAFSEIHPDYYQIPVSDRQALMAEEEQEEPEEERRPRRSRRRRGREGSEGGEGEASEHATIADGQHEAETVEADGVAEPIERVQAATMHHDADEAVSGPAEIEAGAEDGPGAHDAEPAAAVHEGEGMPAAPAVDVTPIDLTAALIERADEAHDRDGPAVAEHAEGEPAAHPVVQAEAVAAQAPVPAPAVDEAAVGDPVGDAAVDIGSPVAAPEAEAADVVASDELEAHRDEDAAEVVRHQAGHDEADEEEEEQVEHVGGDALEEVPRRAFRPRRQYKIQEVIKRRQVLLVQVVKEERGNKGAAITTYLSLAGRYSVLMPNTARGGGISRKITDAGDRQRLKTIAQDLEVPDGMGVILRTAGASRSKPEVKRDFEYLMRAWETVRETTLASTAPTLVYEEGSLIKRAIRDLYNSDVEEIVVAGEEGYREAKAFMRLLQPSHLRNVVAWREQAPLFAKNGAEAQLDAMFHNHVTLKSGGYLVINQTEALVAIDVNSGRSTREHNIEDTALRTNLEAADEVARQLRLRDLAGLIVVDFIDMEEGRNNRAVEKRMKDALKDDRARIQIGRISHFGLLEMSRQRIRTGVLEGSTEACPHCAGAGTVRSTASIALFVLRALEEALLADRSRDMTVRTRGGVALYILNNKRAHLTGIEERFGVAITFEEDVTLIGTSYCGLDKGEPATGVPQMRALPPEEVEEEFEAIAEADEGEDEAPPAAAEEDGEPRRKRRRRRGRGRDCGGADAAADEISGSEPVGEEAPQPSDEGLAVLGGAGEGIETEAAAGEQAADGDTEERGGRKRRSRRGGRRSRGDGRGEDRGLEVGQDVAADGGGNTELVVTDGEPQVRTIEIVEESEIVTAGALADEVPEMPASVMEAGAGVDADAHGEPSAARAETVLHGGTPEASEAAHETENPPRSEAAEVPVARPEPEAHEARPIAEPAEAPTAASETPSAPAEEPAEEAAAKRATPVSSELDPSRPKKSGWWSRAKASLGG